MKQVTIESVKKRISDLQLAEDTFGLGLNGEFELSCLRELVAVTEQRDAVVAENARTRERHYFIRALAMSILEHSGGRMDWRGAMEDASELLKTVDGVYAHTPATDAAIAALRAEGVEMFAVTLGHLVERMVNDRYFETKALEFARQLRESKGADHE